MTGERSGAVLKQLRTLLNEGTAGDLTDRELLNRFVMERGEAAQAAFAVLVERHAPMVLEVCRQLLGDVHDAQDASQATFLVLAKKARSIRRPEAIGSWLHGVALRVAGKAKVAAARRRAHERRGGEMAARSEGEWDRSERWPELHEEIDRLPERYRLPVVLCYLEGLTHGQAALRLGWPVGTVESRLARARDRLRQRLARRGAMPAIALLGARSLAGGAGGAVSPAWIEATARAATHFAAGQAAATLATANVAFLTKGTLKTMALAQLKLAEARPYGGVEGRCLIGNRPVPHQEVELVGQLANPSARHCNVYLNHKTKTDEEGRFTFKNVIATRGLRVNRLDPQDRMRGIWSIGEPVRVEPGATTQVTLGGKGRPLIGRVEPPSGWTTPIDFTDRSEAHIESNRPLTPYPLSLFRGKTALPGSDVIEWNTRWHESPEGHDYQDLRVSIGAGLAPDGSFRIDDVPAGEYRLVIRVNGQATFHITVQRRRDPGPFSHIIQTFTVPPVPGGRSDEPIDLGVLRLQPRVTLKAGEPAPAFEVTTVDGKKLAVPRDFPGKFLLIDFGTMWDIQARHQITLLNAINQKFAKDPRLAILSLTFATDNAEARKFIEDKGEPWAQSVVGPLSSPIASAYGVEDDNVSTTILIGPDGKIVAKDLWRANLDEAIGEALGRADR